MNSVTIKHGTFILMVGFINIGFSKDQIIKFVDVPTISWKVVKVETTVCHNGSTITEVEVIPNV